MPLPASSPSSPLSLPSASPSKTESPIDPIDPINPPVIPHAPVPTARPRSTSLPTKTPGQGGSSLEKCGLSTYYFEQGTDRNPCPIVDTNGLIKMISAPRTDINPNPQDTRKLELEPRLLQRTNTDFESTVRVKFSSTTNYQRASLAVRPRNTGGYGLIRVSMLEGGRIEAIIFSNGGNHGNYKLIPHPEDIAYFKIVKKNGQLSALYKSEIGNEWKILIPPSDVTVSSEMEVFVSVLSTDQAEGAEALFSEWKVIPMS